MPYFDNSQAFGNCESEFIPLLHIVAYRIADN